MTFSPEEDRTALLNGCNAMLGLIQLILARDDLTPELREAIMMQEGHRIGEARAAVEKVTDRLKMGEA